MQFDAAPPPDKHILFHSLILIWTSLSGKIVILTRSPCQMIKPEWIYKQNSMQFIVVASVCLHTPSSNGMKTNGMEYKTVPEETHYYATYNINNCLSSGRFGIFIQIQQCKWLQYSSICCLCCVDSCPGVYSNARISGKPFTNICAIYK